MEQEKCPDIKCGEIYLKNKFQQVTIVCTICDSKLFDFSDFLRHFEYVHKPNEEELTRKNSQRERSELNDAKNFEMIILPEGVIQQKDYQVDGINLNDALEFESNSANIKLETNNVEDDKELLQIPIVKAGSPLNSSSVENETIDFKKDLRNVGNEDSNDCNETVNYTDNHNEKIDDNVSVAETDDNAYCDKTYEDLDEDIQHPDNESEGNTESELQEQALHKEKRSKRFNLRSDPKELRHPCPYCYLTLKSKYSLRNHMRTMHLENPEFKCDLCPRNFRTRQSIKAHLVKHEENGDIRNAKKHLYNLLTRSSKELTCAKCGKAFSDETKLRVHFDQAHINQKYPCNICALVFGDKKKLIEHLKTHLKTKEPPLTCAKCNKTFARVEQLKSHIKKVHEEKPRYLCDVCPATFKELGSLKVHAEKHGMGRERKYTCEHCSMKFYTKNGLKNHVPKHDPKRNQFKCDKCEKTYFSKSALNTHQKCHSDIYFVCNICQRRCYRRIDLEIHMRSHTGETPHKCNICLRAFKYSHMLHEHLRRHKGIKHVCEICGAEYNNRASLMQHRVKHTGNPLLCGLCNKGFIKKYLLQQHIESTHGIADAAQMQNVIIKKDIRKRTPRRPKATVPNESDHTDEQPVEPVTTFTATF